jgi:GNAT superfamily N-acetyltransferase
VNDAAHTAAAGQRLGTRPSSAEPAYQGQQARLRRGLPDARSSLPRQGYRRLRRGRGRQPGDRPRLARDTTVRLRDGSPVLIRPVQATDAPLVAGIFAVLSDTSRWMRFLAAKSALSPVELRYLTNTDHHDHEALAAIAPGGHGVGVPRYIRHAGDPRSAEIAVTVVDEWQGRGLGTQLLTHLSARARRAGIGRFTALASAGNAAAAGLLRAMEAELVGGAGTVEYQITLAPGPGHDPSGRPAYEREKEAK